MNRRPGTLCACALGMLLTLGSSSLTHAADTPDTPRWWCPLVTPSDRHADDPVLHEALAQRDAQPHPMAHVQTHALLPHEGVRDASEYAERDWHLALQAAVGWRLSGDPALRDQVAHYLDAWAGIYVPNLNPIDETNLDQLFQAYMLVRPALPASTRAATTRLIRRIADGYLAYLRRHAGSTYINDTNNWQSHRIKLLATAAAALGDPALIAAAREQLLVQVSTNIRPDGRTVDFDQRDALHYVTYDLEPLVQAALALSPYVDDNLLTARSRSGSSLAAALDWLRPYAEGRSKHQEFVHTSEPFDVKRRKAGLAGYDGTWDPHNAGTLYAYAAVLSPAYRSLAKQLGASPLPLHACAELAH